MPPLWAVAAVVYVVGVVSGLVLTDARPAQRVGLALVWPLGPIAFVVTITILIVATAIAYPLVGIPVLIAIGVAWWMFS